MNKNIWDLYKKSEGGKSAISLFTINENDNLEEKVKAIYFFCSDHLSEKIEIDSAVNRFFIISDRLNGIYGKNTIKLAVQGGDGKAWALRSNFRSPRYLTRLDENIKLKS